MRNLLNILGVISLSIIMISCGNNENNDNSDNSDKQQIKPINDKGLRSSNVSSNMEAKAISYNFDRKTNTVTEIIINEISCREEFYECIELLKLFNEQNIVFKTSQRSVDHKNNEFDRKVAGELHFGDRNMKVTLLFHVDKTEKRSRLLGAIKVGSNNLKKSSSDLIIYVKGKQE